MKSKLISALLGLILVLTAIVPAHAGAEDVKYTVPFEAEFPGQNPCTGEDVWVNISGEARIHEVEDGAGVLHWTFHMRGVVTETNSAGESREGSVLWNDTYPQPGSFTQINKGKVVLPGPRNNVVWLVLTHVSPNGVTISQWRQYCR